MKSQLYIVAHTWKDIELTIEHFHDPKACLKLLGKLTEKKFGKPQADDDPEKYLDRYADWREEHEIDEPEYAICLEIVPLPERDMLREWYDWFNEWNASDNPTEVNEPSIEETARILGIKPE